MKHHTNASDHHVYNIEAFPLFCAEQTMHLCCRNIKSTRLDSRRFWVAPWEQDRMMAAELAARQSLSCPPVASGPLTAEKCTTFQCSRFADNAQCYQHLCQKSADVLCLSRRNTALSACQIKSADLMEELVSYRSQCCEMDGTIAALTEQHDLQASRRDTLPWNTSVQRCYKHS